MRNKLTDELAICGVNAVAAAAEYHPDNINRLFLREDRLRSFTGICKKLAERKRPYKLCEDEELERICKTVHHQGVVAMIYAPELRPLTREDLDDWSQNGKTGLVLPSIGNDHNLGAIVRSAAFFDASIIILPAESREDAIPSGKEKPSDEDPSSNEDNPSYVTTSAYRIAEGGMEHVRIFTVRSITAFLKDASRCLVTIGTDMRARQRIRDLPQIITEQSDRMSRRRTAQTTEKNPRPGIALVLGNEETGLSREIKDNCSILVRIPGTGFMESLNVAQAANLFLYELFNL